MSFFVSFLRKGCADEIIAVLGCTINLHILLEITPFLNEIQEG